VGIRIENGGHFVPENEIERRYHDGYRNLNIFFKQFDNVHLMDSSFYNDVPGHVLSLKDGIITAKTDIPEYLKERIPSIMEQVQRLL